MKTKASLSYLLLLSLVVSNSVNCTLQQATIGDTDDNEQSSGDQNLPGNSGNSTGGNNDSPNGDDNPTFSFDAHIDESCDLDFFPGFILTIHSLDTTCETRFISGEETIQFTVGETTGLPSQTRTYNVSPNTDSWSIPDDGDILAHQGSSTFTSGTLTLKQDGDRFEGTYELWNDEDRIEGEFLSDVCLGDGTDCE